MLLSVYGDSIASAYGLPSSTGFVPKLSTILTDTCKMQIPYLNFGQSGMTSLELASAFRFNDEWNYGLQNASNICILIGGDDLIHNLPLWTSTHTAAKVQNAIKVSRLAYYSILSSVLAKKRTTAQVAVGSLYNPYPNTALACTAVDLYNQAVIEHSAQKFSVPVAHIHKAFEGNQSSYIKGFKNGVAGSPGKDGIWFPIHPNQRGQTVIAQTFAPVVS